MTVTNTSAGKGGGDDDVARHREQPGIIPSMLHDKTNMKIVNTKREILHARARRLSRSMFATNS